MMSVAELFPTKIDFYSKFFIRTLGLNKPGNEDDSSATVSKEQSG